MNKKRLAIGLSIILGVLTLAVASAITIYSGESYSFESEEFEYYTVTGNSSNLEGMNVSWENGNTTIDFQINFAPDSFTLIFFNQETKIITEHHYSSGSSSIRYVDKEVIVEVPYFLDREVIKEVPFEVDGEVIGKREMTEKERKFFHWAIIIGYAVVIPSLIFVIIEKRKKKKKLNSSQEENRTEKEV